MTAYKYVILGGGLVAGYAAREFVECGIGENELCIVSAESELPYERPPLSKDFLAGEKSTEDILINEPAFYEEHGIVVKVNTAVTHVDLDKKELSTDGETISYQKLLIATGAQPRTFDVSAENQNKIFYLRQIEDARQIRQKAKEVERAVVIGGSFIGMEAAAVLQSSGVDTTLIFPEHRVWESFFTPAMSAFFENYYRNRGVTIFPLQMVDSFIDEGDELQLVTTSGQVFTTQMAVAGIGVAPNSQLFEKNGLQLHDGYIQTNRFLGTNFPDVYAAGDVTRYEDVIYERPLHIEHWDNAVQQGRHVARVMMGEYQPYEHVPYFFSDVFDLSYEFWGDTANAVKTVYRGDIEDGAFSVWWLSEDQRLLAAFIMNRPDEEREIAPKWIASGKQLPADWLHESKTLQPEAV